MPDKMLSLATSALGLSAIGLLSLPGILSLVAQLHGRQAQSDVYEDKDGKSTPEATKAFTNKIPRIVVLVLSVLGLGLSVTLAVLATLGQGNGFIVDNWICVGAWVRSVQNPWSYTKRRS